VDAGILTVVILVAVLILQVDAGILAVVCGPKHTGAIAPMILTGDAYMVAFFALGRLQMRVFLFVGSSGSTHADTVVFRPLPCWHSRLVIIIWVRRCTFARHLRTWHLIFQG
jgi:hypothetical protein